VGVAVMTESSRIRLANASELAEHRAYLQRKREQYQVEYDQWSRARHIRLRTIARTQSTPGTHSHQGQETRIVPHTEPEQGMSAFPFRCTRCASSAMCQGAQCNVTATDDIPQDQSLRADDAESPRVVHRAAPGGAK
jgi:hypothetical protein